MSSVMRSDKLRNMVNRIIKQPAGYQNMKCDLIMAAREYGCGFHELRNQTLEYPEEIEFAEFFEGR